MKHTQNNCAVQKEQLNNWSHAQWKKKANGSQPSKHWSDGTRDEIL